MDDLSFVTRQTSAICLQAYVTRPQKTLKTLKKRALSSGNPVAVSVYEKPHGVFARELLLKVLKEGTDDQGAEDEDVYSQDVQGQDKNIIEKIMAALECMIRKLYKLYANESSECSSYRCGSS
jgi:hypothetical protein